MTEKDTDDRQEYTVTIGGIDHQMLLSAEDAERYGESAKKTSTKARTPANKGK